VTLGPVRTVFLGSGAFGVDSLRLLADYQSVDLVGIVTAPARPAGRGQRSTPTPIETVARDLGVHRILTPARLRDPESVRAILGWKPTLTVLADYGQIVPEPLLDLPYGALNLHPSLLPRHRGATPIPATILAGDRDTGVSLIRMDRGLDTGPIIATSYRPLKGTETTPELERALAADAADLLDGALRKWLLGEMALHSQAEDEATMTHPLRREDGRLDARRTAVDLERQVRALQPWPGSFLDTPLGRIVVWQAEPADAGPPVGTFDAEGFGTGDGGRLRLLEVQAASGKRMSWSDYVRGHPAIVGASIVA
jgi:methionyl-tRNA formyltransferase